MRKICPTPLNFIEKFNPDFCSERYDNLNTQELALKSRTIKLIEIEYAYDKDTVIDFIRAWLLNTSLYVRLQVDNHLLKDISRELYKEIFMLNITEFNLFFSKLKRGHYGNLYGRFDGMTICNAAIEYRIKRGQIFSNLTTEEQEII